MNTAPLYISRDLAGDWLSALEFGRVTDGQLVDYFEYVSEQFRWVYDEPGGRVVGFEVMGLNDFEPEGEGYEELWQAPRFPVPLFGLDDAYAGEIIIAARGSLANEPTMNRHLFLLAVGESGETAEGLWRACLETGDFMAHYGLGYTLYELERYREAYGHLRRYAELTSTNAWAWCWLGKACLALGEREEARRAFERALELEGKGSEETEAGELLEEVS